MKAMVFILIPMIVSANVLKIAGLTALELVALPYANHIIHSDSPIPTYFQDVQVLETEPYLQDNFCHYVGAKVLTSMNIRAFQQLGIDSKIPAVALSLAYLTLIEFNGPFSIQDQVFNVCGIIHAVFPEIPIRVRVGFVDNDFGLFQKFADNAVHKTVRFHEMYQYTKTEVSINIGGFYGGVLVSNTTDNDNRLGFTIGFEIDSIKGFAKKLSDVVIFNGSEIWI